MLERQGKLVEAGIKANEAQQRALQAQKGGVTFGPGEDTPAQVLQTLGVNATARVQVLLRNAEDTAVRSQDPARFQKAAELLGQARQLAAVFHHDQAPIEQKTDWLRQLQRGGGPAPAIAQVPPVPPTIAQLPPVPPTIAQVPTLPPIGVAQTKADPRKHGLELLDKARLELRAGKTREARALAEEAYQPQYGLQAAAADVLRSIDTEELAQKQLAVNRNFDAGYDAFLHQDYKQAYIAITSVDERLLTDDRRSRLREIMATKEMQPMMAPYSGKAVVQAGVQDLGKPGLAPFAPGMPEQVGPGTGKAGDTALAEMKMMESIQFQKLNAEKLDVERRAMASAKAGEYDQALDILRAFDASLSEARLSSDRIAVLRRSVERRTGEYKMLKVQEELMKQMRQTRTMDGSHAEKARLEDRAQKDAQIADIMKQYNQFYRQGKFREAWLIACKGRDIDPDNLAIQAAILNADAADGKQRSERVEQNWEHWYNENGDSDDPGAVHNMKRPLTFGDAQRWNDVVKKCGGPVSDLPGDAQPTGARHRA